MKVRFRSPEQQDPQRDQGLKLTMAPAKRQVMGRWRWWLLLALVAAPFLWLSTSFLVDLLSLRGTGYVSYAQLEVRAPFNGQVTRLALRQGQTLAAGAPLLELRRTDVLTMEQAAAPTPSRPSPVDTSAWQRSLERERSLLALYRQLRAQGAATLAEVREAEIRVAQAEQALATLTQANQAVPQPQALPARPRLSRSLSSPGPAQVERLLVQAGEYVSAGTPLLYLRTQAQPEIRAWFDARYIQRLVPGRAATVTLPGGQRLPATIAYVQPLTERLPSPLLSPLGDNKPKLYATLRLDQPLPAEQRINMLPITVRLHWF